MKSTFFKCCAMSIMAAAVSAGAAAPAYPAQPIHIVVPISPGSATDVVVRAISDRLSLALKQPVVVENRPGAGTTIGAAFVARAPADGYTLLANSTAQTVVPWMYPALKFDARKDFVAVAQLANLPNVLVVPASRGVRTVQDLVRAARAQPASLHYASAGIGTSTHLAAERFRRSNGIVAVHVPFKGTPEALSATITGDVDYFFAPAVSAQPYIRSGALAALATDEQFWIGLFAPAGTPPAVVARLNREINAVLAEPEVADKLTQLGAIPRAVSADAFAALVRSDFQANRELVRVTGMAAGAP